MTSQAEASPDLHPAAKNTKTIVVGWLVLFAIGVLASIMAFEHYSGVIKRKAHNDLQAIAIAKKEQVESFIQERHGDAGLLVARAPVWQFLDARGGPVQSPELKPLLDLTLRQTRDAYGYRNITLFNTALRRVAGQMDEPLHPLERVALQAALETRRSAFVDMHVSPDGKPNFGVVHPVFARGDPTRAVVGLAYLEMDATTGLYPRLTRWPVASQSAESLLLRREGDEVVYLSPLRFAPATNGPLSIRGPARDVNYASPAEPPSNQPPLIERNDYRQVRVIAASVPIEGTNWIMVVKVDYDEVNEPVSALRITRLLSGGLLGMLLLIGARLLWHARQMENTAERLRQDARYVAAAQASIDGYLVLDDIGRIVEVNDALVRMTGYSHRELYRKYIADLEAQLSPQQVVQKLSEYRQSEAARFLTQWRHKDGHIIDLQVSATYVAAPKGGTFQAFVRDIGPERSSLQRIERLQSFYVFLSHVNAAIFNLDTRDEILEAVCEGAVRDGGFILAWAGVLDAAAGRVQPAAAYGAATEYIKSLVITIDPALPTSHGPTRMSMVEGTIHYTDDFQNDSRTQPWHALGREHGIHASAAVPIFISGQAVAALTFYAGQKNYFDAEMRTLLEETARYVSLALQAVDAEQAHAQSEERFARVFDASPAPMQIFSYASRRLRGVNKAYKRTFGYQAADIADEAAWFAHVYPDPDLRARLQAVWEQQSLPQAIAGGPETVVQSPEVALRCKDGSTRVVRGFMSVVGDDIIVQWEDLTDIKLAEEQLLADARRFRSMIEQNIAGIYLTQNDRIVYVNPKFCDIVSWSQDELLGQDSIAFFGDAPETRQKVISERNRIQAGEPGVLLTVPFTCKDGRKIELGMQGNLGSWNEAPAIMVMALDLTERQRAAEKIAAYVKQLEGTMRGTLQAVANMVDLRDPYTSGHERRVGIIAADIAREMGWSEDRCQNLQLIGLVHDIGKIAIPAEILSKPTRLTPLEYEMIKGHAEKGYEILKDVEFPLPIAEIIREHHERMDGSGYPRGLKAEEILPEARILAVADVLESMASHRPYRPSLGIEAATRELETHRGTWFDATVVDAVLHLIREKQYQIPM